ncbi:MAG TPA: glycosyltransferase [Chitinophagaceae bacterium]|nr:glycosyltransferase [Chitinophagaceae bacterium]
MIFIAIAILFFLIYACLIIYYRQSWMQIPLYKEQLTNREISNTLISVIIPARNEEGNIGACLTSVVNQSYPKNLFEIIVVDDFSTDSTATIINSFSKENVSLISLKDFVKEGELNSYKKKAIEVAISNAKGALIVTTDADCIVPHLWLQRIASFYKRYHPAFIAAPVAYYGETNFLKIFQTLDFMTLQGITAASVYKKFHSMCNGANLAYEKAVFLEVGGFRGIENIASGDDMLLMNKISDRYPERVLFLKSPDAIVRTKPANTLQDFFNQRIRWASKADKYTDKKIIAVLLLVYLFNAWLLFLGILSILLPHVFYGFIGVLISKTIIELFFLYPVARFFNKEKLLWWFPLAQPLHIIYTVIAGWLGKFGSYKWKERKVK